MSCLAVLFPSAAVNFLASCSPFALQCTKEEGQGVMRRARAIHVDLSLDPNDMLKELKELIPEAFKAEDSSTVKELISSPIAPSSSVLLDTDTQLGSVALHPTFTAAPDPTTKPAQSSNQPPLPVQGEPPTGTGTAKGVLAGLQLKNTLGQQVSELTAPSLHGDSGQPPSNSSTDGTKEDKPSIAL